MIDQATDRTLNYGELRPIDEVYLDGDQVAAGAGAAAAFAKRVPRAASSIVVMGTQPFNLSLSGANPPLAATAGVILIPAGVAVRIGLELAGDFSLAVANVSAAAGNFTYIAFARRRRQPRLPGQE